MTASIWKRVTTLKQSRYFFVEIRTPGERSALLFLVLVFLFQGIETIHLLKHGGRDVERRIGVEQGIGIDDEFVTTIGIKVLDGAVQQVLSPVREDEILFVERFGFLLCRSLVRSYAALDVLLCGLRVVGGDKPCLLYTSPSPRD